jgi:hypothetical protein
MKIVESKDTKRFDMTDYMSNFSPESQTRDNNVNKSKLTPEDFQAIRKRKPKAFFIKNIEDDY